MTILLNSNNYYHNYNSLFPESQVNIFDINRSNLPFLLFLSIVFILFLIGFLHAKNLCSCILQRNSDQIQIVSFGVYCLQTFIYCIHCLK